MFGLNKVMNYLSKAQSILITEHVGIAFNMMGGIVGTFGCRFRH